MLHFLRDKSAGRVSVEIHRELGPGLLETVYEVVLGRELVGRGLVVERQVPVPNCFKGVRFDEGFRADLIVNSKVLVELKSVERVTAAHRKQVQTYLRLTGLKLGYLFNFGEAILKDGITRCVNGLEEGVEPVDNMPGGEGSAIPCSFSPRLSASAGDSVP